jgi:type IV pilus assembly protein PilA
MNRLRLRAEGGFTLIELLVVIAIIGILAAIAIPQFAAYRKRSFAADVKSNLHNSAVAEEAYFVTNNKYQDGALDSNSPEGFNKSKDVTVTAAVDANDPTKYTITGTHANCSGDSWKYDSVGGSIGYTKGTTNCEGS